MSVRGTLLIFSLLLIFAFTFISSSYTYAQETNPDSQTTGQSVYGFIEKMAGKRNFFISVRLVFDVLDGKKRKVFTVDFDMKINNLEDFTFSFKKPETLNGIVVKYNVITKKTDYTYKNTKISESVRADVGQVGGILQNITDFLSSPLFEAKEYKSYTEFRPKNFQILSRFGVQPIIVRLYFLNNLPQKIEISNDKTDEKVTLFFDKFLVE
ncbi:MAG: hypothetical protein ACP5JS_04465 [Fervidobacterium sp.]